MAIEPGIYRHFKGGEYEVLGVGRHSETLEEFVVYKARYTSEEFGDEAIWIRPIALFLETTEVNGIERPRFEKI